MNWQRKIIRPCIIARLAVYLLAAVSAPWPISFRLTKVVAEAGATLDAVIEHKPARPQFQTNIFIESNVAPQKNVLTKVRYASPQLITSNLS